MAASTHVLQNSRFIFILLLKNKRYKLSNLYNINKKASITIVNKVKPWTFPTQKKSSNKFLGHFYGQPVCILKSFQPSHLSHLQMTCVLFILLRMFVPPGLKCTVTACSIIYMAIKDRNTS
jgi:hypothetical protein